MTENIPQTSASERIEQARKALAAYEDRLSADYGDGWLEADNLADTLRALITPPPVGENEAVIVKRVWDATPAHISEDGVRFQADDLFAMLHSAVRAGIQSAHETWEPADHPSQEMMLRWLGIGYFESEDGLDIFEQHIEKEEI